MPDAERPDLTSRLLNIIEASNLELAELRARCAAQDRRIDDLQGQHKAVLKSVTKNTEDLSSLRDGVYGKIGDHSSRQTSIAGRVDSVSGKVKVLWIVGTAVATAVSAPMLKNLAAWAVHALSNGAP